MAGLFDPGVEHGFQRLSLDIPVSVDQFHKVYTCIERVFTSVDPLDLVTSGHSGGAGLSSSSYVPIIGSNIMFPKEAWLRPEVAVKNVKVKVTLLSDIIRVIESELDEGRSHENEVSLAYFEKLLVAFRVFEVPERSSFYSTTTVSSVMSGGPTFDSGSKTGSFGSWRTQSNGSGIQLGGTLTNNNNNNGNDYTFNEKDEDKLNEGITSSMHQVLIPEHHGNSRRSSVFSKEILSGKRRLLSFLLNNHSSNNNNHSGHNGTGSFSNHSTPNLNNGYETLEGPTPEPQMEDEVKRQQALSNLLSKTKLYSKVRKNRDSTGSQMSSAGQRSNRNSASSGTLHKVRNSQTSLMLVESVSLERSGSNSVHANGNQCVIPPLSQAQRLETQKLKSEYLIETLRLVHLAGSMASSLDRANKYSRLIQFIMKFVFKFIMYDIHQMLLDYCQVKEAEVVKRC